MGVISFSKQRERYWQAAGWAFRQLLDDTSHLYPDDAELRELFEEAKLYDSLVVYTLSQEVAEKVVGSVRQVAEGILAGSIQSGIASQSYGNPETQAQYKSGLRELLLALPDRE